jgi:CBS domain containing-hemolysin-like protein
MGKVPVPGETVRFDGLVVEVLTVAGRRIRKVRVSWEQEDRDGESDAA